MCVCACAGARMCERETETMYYNWAQTLHGDSRQAIDLLFFLLLNPSKHNTNEICIITFNGVLLHVSAPGSRKIQ
jgi:hypothetical protein